MFSGCCSNDQYEKLAESLDESEHRLKTLELKTVGLDDENAKLKTLVGELEAAKKKEGYEESFAKKYEVRIQILESKNVSLEEENKRLNGCVKQLEDKNKELVDINEQLEKSNHLLQSTTKELQTRHKKISIVDEENNKLKESIKELENANKELDRRNQELIQSSKETSIVDEENNKLNESSKEFHDTNKELPPTTKKDDSAFEKLEEQYNLLQKQYNDLNTRYDMTKVKAEEVIKLKAENSTFRHDIESLQKLRDYRKESGDGMYEGNSEDISWICEQVSILHKALDIHHNDAVEMSELKRFFSTQESRYLFRCIDLDHDGHISNGELCTFFLKLKKEFGLDVVKDLIQEFNILATCKGIDLLQNKSVKVEEENDKASVDESLSHLTSVWMPILNRRIEQVFARIDMNNDGYIDKNELLVLNNSNEEAVTKMLDDFKGIDENNDGKISAHEFHEFFIRMVHKSKTHQYEKSKLGKSADLACRGARDLMHDILSHLEYLVNARDS